MRPAYVYEKKLGTVGFDDWITVSFSMGRASFVTLETPPSSLLYKLSYDGVTYGDEIEMRTTFTPRTIPFAAMGFQVKKMFVGAANTYSAVAFYGG